MKEAIVFDIDGTLVQSFKADGDLFIEAVRETLGLAEVSSDWSTYRHVTDQGILREILEIHGIEPTVALFEQTRKAFVSLLRRHIAEHGPFPEIPGAVSFVSRLVADEGSYVAYATGAWRESALLKLESAGFPLQGARLSTSSEFEDRVSIMRAALSDAPSTVEKITYYGDGEWDRIAARELGWHFVRVGEASGGLRDFHEACV